MATYSEATSIASGGQDLSGTFLAPEMKIPGVLFIHGWGGSQQFDLLRARSIAGLGCVCLTFDLRGHAATEAQRSRVSRDDNLQDALAAYDSLLRHPAIDSHEVAVVGSSYGGYLAAILSTLRPVKWLALHVPALYRDDDWDQPKGSLSRESLAAYRLTRVAPDQNRALAACEAFAGDVLIVESEHDTFIPHSTIMNYRSAFLRAHSMTHRIVDGADHALTDKAAQRAYTSILVNWTTEMIVGARVGNLHIET
ncbi:alpha/beta hydrolase family protein [Bordetella petrii]|uniref:alpha/beta hydrolase family protein n=1 Tax=Bordetella petrii TaxID=94624 RepID=UPI001E371AEA|nr:alpha/beta fold hydrolase [Bordetella petrii]MCD0504876.1 alpha/beta fold hydrolase [Bordetella petrii]